jgi:hypothetical protein
MLAVRAERQKNMSFQIVLIRIVINVVLHAMTWVTNMTITVTRLVMFATSREWLSVTYMKVYAIQSASSAATAVTMLLTILNLNVQRSVADATLPEKLSTCTAVYVMRIAMLAVSQEMQSLTFTRMNVI